MIVCVAEGIIKRMFQMSVAATPRSAEKLWYTDLISSLFMEVISNK